MTTWQNDSSRFHTQADDLNNHGLFIWLTRVNLASFNYNKKAVTYPIARVSLGTSCLAGQYFDMRVPVLGKTIYIFSLSGNLNETGLHNLIGSGT